MNVSGLVALFLLINTPFVSAYDNSGKACTKTKAVDLRQEFGPIRSQGNVGWCYAYVAADLLGHYLWRHGEMEPLTTTGAGVSATATAIRLLSQEHAADLEAGSRLLIQKESEKRRHTKKILDAFQTVAEKKIAAAVDSGGAAVDAIEILKEGGYCSEKTMPSDSFDRNLIYQVNLLTETELFPFQVEDRIKLMTLIAAESYQDLGNSLLAAKIFFPQLHADAREAIMKTSQAHRRLYDLMDASCEWTPLRTQPQVVYESISEYDEPEERKKDLHESFKVIDAQLLKRNPVEVATDGNLFSHLPAQNYDLSEGHILLLVGIRPGCGKEETRYVVRNSWGTPSCEYDHMHFADKSSPQIIDESKRLRIGLKVCREDCGDNLSCEKKCVASFKEKHVKINKPPFTCEDGYYIVKKSHLSKVLYHYGYLE